MRTLFVLNIVVVVLKIIINYGMGSTMFVFGDPFPDVRASIAARGLSQARIGLGLRPEMLSLEMEFVYFQFCKRLSSMLTVRSLRE